MDDGTGSLPTVLSNEENKMVAVSTVRNVCQPHESCHFTNLDAREQAISSKASLHTLYIHLQARN